MLEEEDLSDEPSCPVLLRIILMQPLCTAASCLLELLKADHRDAWVARSSLPFLLCVVAPVYQVQLPAAEGVHLADLASTSTTSCGHSGTCALPQIKTSACWKDTWVFMPLSLDVDTSTAAQDNDQ